MLRLLSLTAFLILWSTSIVLGQIRLSLDSAYEGGPAQFYRLTGTEIDYLDRSAVGVCLVTWTVNRGEIEDISIKNSSGKTNDQEVMRVLERTAGQWKEIDTVVQYWLPVRFKGEWLDFLANEYPEYFLDELLVTGSAVTGTSDESLINRVNKSIEKQKLERAIRYLYDLIARYPFNKELRETRIYCLNILGLYSSACEDVAFIEKYFDQPAKYPCIQVPE